MSHSNEKSINDAIYYTLIDHPNVAFTVRQMFDTITAPNAVVDDCIKKNIWSRSEYEKFSNFFFDLPNKEKSIVKRYRYEQNRLEPVLLFSDKETYQYSELKTSPILTSELSDYETLEALREIVAQKHKYSWFNINNRINRFETPLTFTIKMKKFELFRDMLLLATYDDLLTTNHYDENVFDCVKKTKDFNLSDMLLERVKQLFTRTEISRTVNQKILSTNSLSSSRDRCLYFIAGTITAMTSAFVLFGTTVVPVLLG
jgi:hypothetical protein